MSLLMQALRKAERAKKSHVRDNGLTKPSEEFDGVLSLMLNEPEHDPGLDGDGHGEVDAGLDFERTHEAAPAAAPAGKPLADSGRAAPGSGPELRLAPVEDGIPVLEPLLEPLDYPAGQRDAVPLPDPAHSATLPPAGAAAAAIAATAPPRDEPSIHMAGPHDIGLGDTPRPAAARTARTENAASHPRPRAGGTAAQGPRPRGRGKEPGEARVIAIDPGTLRLALLGGILLLILAVFVFVYWRALTGPGEGSRLPMVPMPQQGAGATAPGNNNGMAVIAPNAGPLAAGAPAGTVTDDALGGPPGAAAPGAVEGNPSGALSQPGQSHVLAQAPSPEALPDRSFTPPAGPALQRPPTSASSIPPGAMPDPGFSGPAPQAQPAPGSADSMAAPVQHGGRMAEVPQQQGQRQSAQAAQGNPDGADIRVRRNESAPRINPGLQAAYQAFNDGDLASARQQYQAVIRQEPANRDALLGMAALAVRQKDVPQAAAQYMRMLELDPNDAEAVAGLTSLHVGDPSQSEGRLKAALQNNPESGPVLFALGNLYSQQSRWSEAQQMYFRAYAATPSNADYAFNLAVGLDRLNQGKIALGYYQRALALSSNGGGAFDRDAARRRLHELTQATAPAAVSAPASPAASATAVPPQLQPQP
jgi:Tfp pilus assembly protein PilF